MYEFRKYGVILILLCVLLALLACVDQDARELENLQAFAKLYGYVRFFYPGDEAAELDWEAFAVHGVGKIKGARNHTELRSQLEQLFLPIAPALQLYGEGESAPDIELPEQSADHEVVAWQHQGVDLGRGGGFYQSKRLNRQLTVAGPGAGFGTVTASIDAEPYRGRSVRLRAGVRVEVQPQEGQGQLWLRVDRPARQRGFFDNMSDRPVASDSWALYEITGEVADDATRIVFGCFLHRQGRLWVDQFELEVNTGEGEWQPIEIDNAGFEESRDGEPWSRRSVGYSYTVTDQQPLAGEHSMLIERDMVKLSEPLFEQHAEIGEVIDKQLIPGLHCRIPLALYSRDGKTLPEPELPTAALADELRVQQQELSAQDQNVRLAAVIIAWNVFQHFYPYFDVVDVDWDQMLGEALSMSRTDTDQAELLDTLRYLVAGLQDGHGHVRIIEPEPEPEGKGKEAQRKAGLPIMLDWIEQQVVITASREPTLEPGDILLGLDGRPAAELMLEEERLISGSPQWKRVRALFGITLGELGSTAKLDVSRGDQTLELSLERQYGAIKAFVHPPIEEYQDGVFYVDLSNAGMKEISQQMDRIARAPGVVFDLRGYPKSNHDVIRHLLSENDSSTSWMRIPKIIYPDQKRLVGYMEHGWELTPAEPHIDGKVVFITGGMAISYAESFMSFIEGYDLAEIVGSPTAGTNGNVNFLGLPGGYSVSWTGMRVVKHDGSQHHLIGIQPTVSASPTIAGVRAGRDELLERALELIREPGS